MLIFDINIPRFTPFVNSFCKFSYEFFVNSALRVQIPETGGGCPEWNGSNWLLADASIMRTIRGCNTCRRRGAQNRIGRRGNVVLDSGEPPGGRRNSRASTAEIARDGGKACRYGENFSRRRNQAEGRRKSPAPAPELPGRGAEVARRRRTAGFSPKNKSRPEGGFNSAKTYVRRSDTECWSRFRRAEETAAWCCP